MKDANKFIFFMQFGHLVAFGDCCVHCVVGLWGTGGVGSKQIGREMPGKIASSQVGLISKIIYKINCNLILINYLYYRSTKQCYFTIKLWLPS